MRRSLIAFVFSLFVVSASNSQIKRKADKEQKSRKERSVLSDVKEKADTLIGTASFYASKFTGRETTTGEIYNPKKLTAACNRLPLGTWIRVTNLKNMKSIIVQINDRLHWKNKRLVDLSYAGAKFLGYIQHGLAQVSIEILSPNVAIN